MTLDEIVQKSKAGTEIEIRTESAEYKGIPIGFAIIGIGTVREYNDCRFSIEKKLVSEEAINPYFLFAKVKEIEAYSKRIVITI